MPGSVTIGHTDALVMLRHRDAERLATMLRELSSLMTTTGGGRLSAEQIATLCGPEPCERAQLADWTARMADYLRDHL
ncbi:hypothetical protein CFP65_3226 [Kitasatospora sp. MMS16-BH015]|uniref:hypothetical protein n=1 Tax=Kitasatospora sp. MMS16-BH015 TaxID=2018025 RepID=UPI000CA308D4|nr:hypothetical protein [Kitasatospora sp. MMS16-BH015]AUG78030.1 hypothetical protein CFP65_3226 [Kitasatospora sp. MMS16-BH015]